MFLGVTSKLKDALFEHCRKLIHAFLKNHEATFAVLRHYHEWRVEHSSAVRHMASLLVQRRYLLRYDFVTTRDQALERERYREGREKRISKISARVTALLDNLQRINKDNASELKNLHDDIQKTEVQLMELEVESKSRVRDVYRKFARKYSENRQQFESKMQLLGEDLEQVKTEFTEHRDKAKRDRQGLRRQLNKSGEVVAMCLNNMDDKLFDLELRYGVVMKKYEELSKEHEALLTEFQEEEERQRLAREKAEMIQAATFIQSLYRSWKTRKEIKKAGRKMR
ncbi:unnamed protein product [Mesocestoides corti]|uniref:Dynein regulatory complex protein 10 n=1 Tax=Mesocestoides corti TaxID=53468 RepID=A0A0R3U462_MESCO|nr:unnamed protein product [Mesocestoides corti]